MPLIREKPKLKEKTSCFLVPVSLEQPSFKDVDITSERILISLPLLTKSWMRRYIQLKKLMQMLLSVEVPSVMALRLLMANKREFSSYKGSSMTREFLVNLLYPIRQKVSSL